MVGAGCGDWNPDGEACVTHYEVHKRSSLHQARANSICLVRHIGGTMIQSRAPIIALTTAFTFALTACLLFCRGSWLFSATFLSISVMMCLWQIRNAYDAPALVVHGPIVILYRRGITAGSFALSDLSITEGFLGIVVALFALVLAGAILGALGISSDLETSLSLRLSSNQRLLLSMSGVWLTGAAVSLAYLDLPRRKLLLRGASRCPSVIYFENRNQRCQLLLFLRALKLEEVMLRVGLGSDTDPHLDNGHGLAR
jgi:hypothetical protein